MSLFLFIEYGRLILEVEIMSGLIEFLTTEEMILVYVLVGIASVLYFIIYILDKTAMKRKQRQNTRELQKIVLESSTDSLDEKVENVSEEPVLMPITEEMKVEEPVVLEVKESEPVLEVSNVSQAEEVAVMPEVERLSIEEQPVQVDATEIISEESTDLPKVEEELQYTSIEPDPSEAQAELMRLTETLEKAEEEVKNIDLTAFEEEQEQNAIISLDELMSRNKALYESGELEKLEDEGNEPISLQDLEERMKTVQTDAKSVEVEPSIVAVEESISEPKQMVLDDFQTVSISTVDTTKVEEKPVYQEHKKFKSSPVISPVFGIEKPAVNNSSDIELENTANYEKLDEEIRKTNEFLMTLKELQKNLD